MFITSYYMERGEKRLIYLIQLGIHFITMGTGILGMTISLLLYVVFRLDVYLRWLFLNSNTRFPSSV